MSFLSHRDRLKERVIRGRMARWDSKRKTVLLAQLVYVPQESILSATACAKH